MDSTTPRSPPSEGPPPAESNEPPVSSEGDDLTQIRALKALTVPERIEALK